MSYELWKLEIQTPLNLNITHRDGGGKQSEAAWNMWASPFVRLVKLTLEIKGIQYEYVEEDLVNKSLVLLKYNPVHKKVPVLVVNGKPLVESLIILEYIDETWKNSPRFLPENPYKKALLRFCCSFVHEQVSEKFTFEFMPLCMVNIT